MEATLQNCNASLLKRSLLLWVKFSAFIVDTYSEETSCAKRPPFQKILPVQKGHLFRRDLLCKKANSQEATRCLLVKNGGKVTKYNQSP